jgi:hypothetical protein
MQIHFFPVSYLSGKSPKTIPMSFHFTAPISGGVRKVLNMFGIPILQSLRG